VVSCILERTQKHGAGLIVLGSHGHGAFYNLLVGSVAEGVLRESIVPVVVVPAKPALEKKQAVPVEA
jgi:nucleotide-binding universal stress UspA family protein